MRLLLELRAVIRTVQSGTVIHLLTTDPAAPLDLAAWCHLTGHTNLGPVDSMKAAPAYGIRTVGEAARPTDADNPWRSER
ncbi:sulfurtransferase TusA family protein [Micromonospora sp. NPDC047548]|uniref:sulfurtransferase TusA family protein n=1 Tax=Micromonospora sp. NPDC047548 TaxID=3155624 RepID=UPI00340A8858